MRPHDTHIPIEELYRRLRYDEERGVLVRRKGKNAGKDAGYPHDGYIRLGFSGSAGHRDLLAHRVIWAMKTGAWPVDRIDHRDGDGMNNRWGNLRPATMPQQMQNKGLYKNGKSGLTGASFHKRIGKWQSYINVDKKRRYLGYFDTAEEAHAAHLDAKKSVHPFQPIPR